VFDSPLTFNLKQYLLERFKADEEITGLFGKEEHLVSQASFGAFVRGDGDQTPIESHH